MNYESFFERVEAENINFTFDNKRNYIGSSLNNEALFHLPFLALIILMLAKGRRKPKTQQIGQLVGECLERSLIGFRGSAQHLGWSANLRMRTVRALSFLEIVDLIKVNNKNEIIDATELGHKIINNLFKEDTELSYTLRIIDQSYRNICIENKIELELL